MNSNSATLINRLVVELTPVRPLRVGHALICIAFALIVSVLLIAIVMDPRSHVTALFLVSVGLIFALGLAASLTVIVMARPQFGSDRSSCAWVAMAAFPLGATLLMGMQHPASAWSQSNPHAGAQCLSMGLVCGLANGFVLVTWLRRGAPTSPDGAGMITGLAAGSFGMFSYSLYCPSESIYHIGLWHGASVIVAALIGRLIVPRLIIW